MQVFKVSHPEIRFLPPVQLPKKPILRVKSESSVEVAE